MHAGNITVIVAELKLPEPFVAVTVAVPAPAAPVVAVNTPLWLIEPIVVVHVKLEPSPPLAVHWAVPPVVMFDGVQLTWTGGGMQDDWHDPRLEYVAPEAT